MHVLATIDSAHERLSLIAVNSGQRTVTAGIEVDAPAAMTGSFSCEHDMLSDGATFESSVSKPEVTGPSFRFSADLPPRSLSAFECMRLPADVRPRPRSTGWRIGQPYPNPFTGAMTIGIGSQSGGTLQVRVFDMLGRRMRTLHDGWAAPGSLSLRWNGQREDGQKCPAGPYTIQVLSGEKLTVRPVFFQ